LQGFSLFKINFAAGAYLQKRNYPFSSSQFAEPQTKRRARARLFV
jgi:hypothetical protein